MGEDLLVERTYKSIWHIAMFCVGLYELTQHKSKIGKVLGAGMAAFHIDAAIADAFDAKPLSRVLIEKATGVSNGSEYGVAARSERFTVGRLERVGPRKRK